MRQSKKSTGVLESEPLTLEKVSHELDALLEEVRRGDFAGIEARIETIRTAIGRIALCPPAIDLAGNVPEQVGRLCRWFRAKIAAVDAAVDTERDCKRQRQPIVSAFQTQINSVVGRSFGAEGNAAIVKELREALKATKYRVECACGYAGLPYHLTPEQSATTDGAFQIILYYKVRDDETGRMKNSHTAHGGPTTFPGYAIIPAPAELPAVRPPRHSQIQSR